MAPHRRDGAGLFIALLVGAELVLAEVATVGAENFGPEMTEAPGLSEVRNSQSPAPNARVSGTAQSGHAKFERK